MKLVFLLEEPSARNMLEGIIHRLCPDLAVQYIVFEGKQDLEKQLSRRIKFWKEPDSLFIIMRDQDSGDCRRIKQHLLELAEQSAKKDHCLVRIACHELESFFLGDLQAVEQGLNLKGLAVQQRKKKYKSPDELSNAAQELKELTHHAYSKLKGSRSIAPHLKIDDSNRSHSFKVLCEAIRKQAARLTAQAPTSQI